MIKSNVDKLPMISVMGQVANPSMRGARVYTNGMSRYLVGTGGISYNAKVGDLATGWVADHLEPGVSSKNTDNNMNMAYNVYSCIGNEVTVVSGDAKGDKGFVVGTHGGIEHVMLHFGDETLEKLLPEDKVLVRAWGLGMELSDYPDILMRGTGPQLLEKLNIIEEDGCLKVGVAKIVPGCIMGSGLGATTAESGDYDITLHDKKITDEYGLMGLRFGDIVAITDADTRYGRTFQTGACTIGVVVHSDCVLAGHGPGVTTIMTALDNKIKPFIDDQANLKFMFC